MLSTRAAASLPSRTFARPEGERGVDWPPVARHCRKGTRDVRAHSAARQRADFPHPRPGRMNTSLRRGYIFRHAHTLAGRRALARRCRASPPPRSPQWTRAPSRSRRGGTKPTDRIGQESFTIRRTRGPGGDVVVANATVTFDTEHLAPALRTDTSFSPLAYQVEVRTGADVERLRGRIGGGRFSAQLKNAKGESSKEYIVSDGALILDDDIFHQYYFLVQRARGGSATIPVVIPRRNTAGDDAHSGGRERAGARRHVVAWKGVTTRSRSLRAPRGRCGRMRRGASSRCSWTATNITATRDALPR